MKKIILLAFVILLASCNNEVVEKTPDSLEGTTWKYEENKENYKFSMTLEFLDLAFNVYYVDGDNEYIESGVYKYNQQSVTLSFIEKNGEIKGTVRGNTISFYVEGDSIEYKVFYKQ